MISLLGVDDFAAMEPAGRNFNGSDQRAPLRMALTRWGQYGPDQTAGRFYPVACVALEITQRCNLDCTLCYLSDAAEIVHDVPLDVLLSRVDMIYSHYGPLTSIQITGGEPSLRKVEDLEKLCRYISESGMRSCLMTNGIKASAQLLGRLARAGLDDVAFHVDLTQKRKGYPTEASLNELRREYIERAKGLKLRILFNTTIFGGNINEVPALSRFFRAKAAEITLASFQLQADTGRGVLRERDNTVTPESVMALISDGIQAQLHFDTTAVGHPTCTRYCSILVAGDQAVSALSDRSLLRNVLGALEASECRIGAYLDFTPAAWRAALRHPLIALSSALFVLQLVWRLRSGLWSTRGRIHRMALVIHNFMDAEGLERDRCESCIFMVATENGPLSMCVHNARRDHHILTPARVETPRGTRWWNAATGELSNTPQSNEFGAVPFKHLKGRMRAAATAEKTE